MASLFVLPPVHGRVVLIRHKGLVNGELPLESLLEVGNIALRRRLRCSLSARPGDAQRRYLRVQHVSLDLIPLNRHGCRLRNGQRRQVDACRPVPVGDLHVIVADAFEDAAPHRPLVRVECQAREGTAHMGKSPLPPVR